MNVFGKLWPGWTVAVGHPLEPQEWEHWPIAYLRQLAWIRWARLLRFADGGYRLLLCSYLQVYDPGPQRGYYNPLLWLEWAPARGSEPRQLLVRAFIPPDGLWELRLSHQG